MKKLILAIGLGFISSSVYAGCVGNVCSDDVRTTLKLRANLPVYTGNEISLLNGVSIGDLVICSTCTNAGTSGYALCVATTTVPTSSLGNGFLIVNATNTAVQCR